MGSRRQGWWQACRRPGGRSPKEGVGGKRSLVKGQQVRRMDGACSQGRCACITGKHKAQGGTYVHGANGFQQVSERQCIMHNSSQTRAPTSDSLLAPLPILGFGFWILSSLVLQCLQAAALGDCGDSKIRKRPWSNEKVSRKGQERAICISPHRQLEAEPGGLPMAPMSARRVPCATCKRLIPSRVRSARSESNQEQEYGASQARGRAKRAKNRGTFEQGEAERLGERERSLNRAKMETKLALLSARPFSVRRVPTTPSASHAKLLCCCWVSVRNWDENKGTRPAGARSNVGESERDG